MESNTPEKEKQESTKSEQNLNNVPLETIKLLKTLSKETLLKPRFQDGIPIVSNYLYENWKKAKRKDVKNL